MEKSDIWERKFMVFDESGLHFYKGRTNSEGSFTISMDKVISFRADVSSRLPLQNVMILFIYLF
jgi:hypothetical protein